ncbi:hypothetical protein D3C79_885390 [compost metagenome]
MQLPLSPQVVPVILVSLRLLTCQLHSCIQVGLALLGQALQLSLGSQQGLLGLNVAFVEREHTWLGAGLEVLL